LSFVIDTLLRWCSIEFKKSISGLTPNTAFRKFGKHLQKRQLDIPEYAASFVNYKALKQVKKDSPITAAWLLTRK